MLSKNLRVIIGLATIIAFTLHILSDLLEVFSGGFSAAQLWINYVAFLPIPFLMIGLYAFQLPLSGWMSLTGAIAYGTSFIFFAGTTLYALVAKTVDYSTLLEELGDIYTYYGGLMVAGGILFGIAVIRARVLPRWTGRLLIFGVSLNLLFSLLAFPNLSQIIGSLVRNIAFIGMGIAILKNKKNRKITNY
ncbi:MAG: hypothetical protein AB4372_08395 [Xenococcus sp. (in: cyanobacteria)]